MEVNMIVESNVTNGLLNLVAYIEIDKIRTRLSESLIDLNDKAVIKELIKLGWTPPPEDK